MKTSAAVSIVVVFLVAGAAARQASDADVRLKAASHRELVDGDVVAAIEQYKEIAASPKTSRSIAARALLNLANAYEKLADSSARPTYERIVRDYADQRPVADAARARLNALGLAASVPAPAKRLVVNHDAFWSYGKPSRDGRSYLRYNPDARAFEQLDLRSGSIKRIATEGPARQEAGSNGQFVESNDRRRLAATFHIYRDGNQNPPVLERAELRLFDVGGRGPGRVVLSYAGNKVIRFSVRPFAWSPHDDRVWAMVMFRDNSAQIVSVDMKGGVTTLATMAYRDHSQPPSLSPDGRYVAYHDRPNQQTPPDVVIAATDGSGSFRIEHPADDNKPMFVPDGSGIVFESDRRGARDLWFQPLANGRPTGQAWVVWRNVAPLGEIARFADSGALFYYFAANDYASYTAPLEVTRTGSPVGDRTRLPSPLNEMNTGPMFSPDGKSLLFARASGRRLVVRDLASGREREIPTGMALGLYTVADWCADNESALVTGFVNGRGGVTLLVNVKDGTSQTLFDATVDYPTSAVCVGRREIVYARWSNASTSGTIVRRALDSGQEAVLFTGDVRLITRSFDGRRIAFIVREQNIARILTLPLDGTAAPREVMTAPRAASGRPLLHNVAWMPNGNLLVLRFSDDAAAAGNADEQYPLGMWEVGADGGSPRRLGELPISAIKGYFAGVFSVTVHPTGRTIAYQSHEGYVEQTWAIENLAQLIKAGAGR